MGEIRERLQQLPGPRFLTFRLNGLHALISSCSYQQMFLVGVDVQQMEFGERLPLVSQAQSRIQLLIWFLFPLFRPNKSGETIAGWELNMTVYGWPEFSRSL